MLVLTRQKDESIIIGNNIKITVVGVRNGGVRDDQVRLGITAPKRISVHREEVYKAIQSEKGKKHAAASKKAVNNRMDNNRAGICGMDNTDEEQGLALIGGDAQVYPGNMRS